MGGGKGGGGPQIPDFVKESQKMTGERAQQLYDVGKPVMSEGVRQIQSLMTTGGPGAQVPIISNMETGQQQAFNVAQREIGEAMARGGGAPPEASQFGGGGKGKPRQAQTKGGGKGKSDKQALPDTASKSLPPSFRRILEEQNIEHQARQKAIAPSIAAPLISAGMGAALGGGGLAQAGYQSAAQALASGVRHPKAQSGGGFDSAQFGSNVADVIGGIGGGKGGGMSEAWKVGGPTSFTYAGSGGSPIGASAPGIMLEF